ncbi:MAG TPA: hypothetical protein VL049_11785 [Candidatus Dormibacteraeota bacterium]|nr:hypothetical protein [Candidatus Dormibacteraeota bacterium]
MTWDVVLGYVTGLRIISPDITAATLLRTTIVVHITDAVLCRLFAHNNGYNKNLWTTLGLIFGIWAAAVLLVLPKRGVTGDQ